MNPDRHLQLALRLLPRPGARRRRQRRMRTASSTTNTTPCSTCRPSTTSTRSRSCSRTSRWSTAPGRSTAELVRPQDIKTTALLTIEGELDDISGAGQTRAAHELCTGIPKARQFHYDVDGRRPLRHLLGPPLAREGLSAGARLHRCAPGSFAARSAAASRAARPREGNGAQRQDRRRARRAPKSASAARAEPAAAMLQHARRPIMAR